jgi:hypothetical protein
MTSPLKISSSPTEELRAILKNNIIGTPGKGMLYQHTTSSEKLDAIIRPFFVNLIRYKRILGTCTFSVRESIDRGMPHTSAYLRYFYFKDSLRRNSSHITPKVSVLREALDDLLTGHQFGLPEKHFYYAYYDPDNERSVLFCKQHKFEEVRTFTTILFTRLSNVSRQTAQRMEVLNEKDLEVMRTLLSDYYSRYTMFSFENLIRLGDYYVIRDKNNAIVAGLQVNPDRWKLFSLKPPLGKLKLEVAARIPFINRVVGKHLSFLSVEGVYCREGHEHDLEKLLESLLHRYMRHVAILFVDDQSTLKTLFHRMDLGILGRSNSGNKAKVICRFQGFTEEEKRLFYTQPAYISSIDLT